MSEGSLVCPSHGELDSGLPREIPKPEASPESPERPQDLTDSVERAKELDSKVFEENAKLREEAEAFLKQEELDAVNADEFETA
jgi:hypothetical protein